MRERGSQMIPGVIGQILPGVDFMESVQMSAEEYCARVLARFCENAIGGAKTTKALMINYNQLPEVVTMAMLEHFQVRYSPEDIESIKSAARFNAKTPGIPFTSDSAAKREKASAAAREAAEKWVNPLYEQLEKIRQGR
jgi:hypothetical protein